MANGSGNWSHDCAPPEGGHPCAELAPWLPIEFVLVVCIGGSTAVLSILMNTLLLLVFVSKATLLSTYFFLTVLAGLDILMGLFYISLMMVRVLSEYILILKLNAAWYAYVTPVFTISHIVMTSSALLLVFATFERFRGADSLDKFPFTQRQRVCLALLAIAIGMVIKGPLYWEFKVIEMPHCEPCNPVGVRAVAHTAMAQNFYYSTIWMFWFRNIAVVFLPFLVLCYLNLGIVLALRRQSHSTQQLLLCPDIIDSGMKNGGIGSSSAVALRVRNSTRMLFIVSFSYLVANVINVLITAWEHIDYKSLFLANAEFYHLAADTVSLLTIVAGALRLPSYSWCNPELRHEIKEFLCPPKPKVPPSPASPAAPQRQFFEKGQAFHHLGASRDSGLHTIASLEDSQDDVML